MALLSTSRPTAVLAVRSTPPLVLLHRQPIRRTPCRVTALSGNAGPSAPKLPDRAAASAKVPRTPTVGGSVAADLISCWSSTQAEAQASEAAGRKAAAGTAAKPSLSMRPITTHVNVLVAGGSNYLGRKEPAEPPAESADSQDSKQPSDVVYSFGSADEAATKKGQPGKTPAGKPAAMPAVRDDHASFRADAGSWSKVMPPILVPEACREMIYKFTDSPSQGSTLDLVDHLRSLMGHLLAGMDKDYKQLHGARGLQKSLACGCLQHTTTALIYLLPAVPGPSKLDLVVMSALSRHVALLLAIGKLPGMTAAEGEAAKERVRQLLAQPDVLVQGLEPVQVFRLSPASDPNGTMLPLLLEPAAAGDDGSAPAALHELVRLLGSNEVYGLLDHAYDSYTAFCNSNDACEPDGNPSKLQRLTDNACAAAELLLDASRAKRERLRGQLWSMLKAYVAWAKEQGPYRNASFCDFESSNEASLRALGVGFSPELLQCYPELKQL